MGRTQRRRKEKFFAGNSAKLDTDESIINLKRWMTTQGWLNETHLQLREFAKTGRGVTSRNNIHPNDVLINVPYKLLITFETVWLSDIKNMFSRITLKMHEYLSLFLIIEQHKGDKSNWKEYIKSLPREIPNLIWLHSQGILKLLPKDLREAILKRRSDFEESWLRVKQSIDPGWTCNHCNIKMDCVINQNIFTWAYVLVNTRAVYFDPQVLRKIGDCSTDIVSDEPCMALCPFLDMFNHNSDVKTEAQVVDCDGNYFYQLKTMSSHNKYEQVFISYGPLDNLKLLLEYGFILPVNNLDSVAYTFDEVLKILNLKLDKKQYVYIKDHCLDNELFVANTGASFNLKAILFIAHNKDVKDYGQFIYSGSDHDISVVNNLIKDLLSFKLAECKNDLKVLEESVENVDNIGIIVDFLSNRVDTVELFLYQYMK